MGRRLIRVIATAAALAVAFPAMSGQADLNGAQAVVSVVDFSLGDRQVIFNFFLRHDGYLDSVPPRLRRQLVIKGQVPTGVDTKPLPQQLAANLSALPAGFERVMAGPDVLLVEITTGLIVDIIRDVVR